VPVRRITPERYRRLTVTALVFLAVIIVTGAAVRLTGSGLGCHKWPNCEPGNVVAARDYHQAVEQINRLFTGVMAVAIMVCLAGAWLRTPRRRDLTSLATSLVVGFFLQAVVGGLVVLTKLHPLAVMWHFLLSGVVLVAGLVLHQRAGEGPGPYRTNVSPPVLRLVRWCAASGALAVIAGTVVTNTGPHGGAHKGDPVRRFPMALVSVTRVHSILVFCLLGLLLVLYRHARRSSSWALIENRLEAVFFAVFVQGAIGYFQYFTKLPVMLVGAHIIGSIAVIITLTRLVLVTRSPIGATDYVDIRQTEIVARPR
jgi:heme a synthase